MLPETWGSRITTSDPENVPIECPAAIVVNRGHYTITGLRAQLCTHGKSLNPHGRTEHFSSWWNLPEEIKADLLGVGRDIYLSTLPPTDPGDEVQLRRHCSGETCAAASQLSAGAITGAPGRAGPGHRDDR